MAEANRLTLKINKTDFVLFRSSQRILTEHIFLKIGNKKLKQESHVRFLGVSPGSALSWKFHISELSERTCKNSWSLFRDQALCSTRHTNASLSCYFCPIFGLWGISLGPDLSIAALGGGLDKPTDRDQGSWVFLNDPKKYFVTNRKPQTILSEKQNPKKYPKNTIHFRKSQT